MSRVPYSDYNRSKIEKMLERDAGAVKAVVARTVETRKLAAKLPIIDLIFNNARMNLGYKISYEQFETIFKEFQEADEKIAAIIEKAEEFGLYTPRGKRTSDYQKYKEQIIQMLNDGKSDEEIANEINIELSKVQGWIGNIKAELKEKEKTATEANSE